MLVYFEILLSGIKPRLTQTGLTPKRFPKRYIYHFNSLYELQSLANFKTNHLAAPLSYIPLPSRGKRPTLSSYSERCHYQVLSYHLTQSSLRKKPLYQLEGVSTSPFTYFPTPNQRFYLSLLKSYTISESSRTSHSPFVKNHAGNLS